MIFQQGDVRVRWFSLFSPRVICCAASGKQRGAFFSKMLCTIWYARGSLRRAASNPFLISSLTVREMVCKEDADVSSLSIFISFLPQKILVLIFVAGLCSLEFKSALFPMFNALSSFIFPEHPCPLCSGNYITLVYHKHFQGEKTKPVLILAHSGITLSEMNLSL